MSILGNMILGVGDEEYTPIVLITINGECAIVCESSVIADLLRTVCRNFEIGDTVYVGTLKFIIRGIKIDTNRILYLLNNGQFVREELLSSTPQTEDIANAAERSLDRLESLPAVDDPDLEIFVCPTPEESALILSAEDAAKKLAALSEITPIDPTSEFYVCEAEEEEGQDLDGLREYVLKQIERLSEL